MSIADSTLPVQESTPVKRPTLRPLSWEDCRGGEACEVPDDEVPPSGAGQSAAVMPFAALHRFEYGLLRQIQRVPGLLPISMGVHYSLLPKVITPLLALIVWLGSLPRGASLITFVCAADCLNTALKWAVQRPRPRWYARDAELVANCGAWEVDLSFPSAHTQFFSGLAFCAAALYAWPLWLAAAVGVVIGITRNFLSMHWPTDTLAALVLGGGLGVTWGAVDPFQRLLQAGSPWLSLGVATAFTSGLLSLMVAVRQAVPPVAAEVRMQWYANALAALPPDERDEVLQNPRKQLKPRNLKSKLPMLVTVGSQRAITQRPISLRPPPSPRARLCIHTCTQT